MIPVTCCYIDSISFYALLFKIWGSCIEMEIVTWATWFCYFGGWMWYGHHVISSFLVVHGFKMMHTMSFVLIANVASIWTIAYFRALFCCQVTMCTGRNVDELERNNLVEGNKVVRCFGFTLEVIFFSLHLYFSSVNSCIFMVK